MNQPRQLFDGDTSFDEELERSSSNLSGAEGTSVQAGFSSYQQQQQQYSHATDYSALESGSGLQTSHSGRLDTLPR